MRVNFFEEFPDENTLSKTQQIDFPFTIFLAAKSLREYDQYRQMLSRFNKKLDTVYWPILKKSYWLSHFSFPSEIEELITDIKSYKSKQSLKIMLDLELPIIRPWVFLHTFKNFSQSRQAFRKLLAFLKDFKIPTFTAETTFTSTSLNPIARKLGLAFDQNSLPHTVIPMAYTSNPLDRLFFKKLLKCQFSYIGVGTIAKGIFGHEPILSANGLDSNLRDIQHAGVKNVVVFRLGGLNQDYLPVLQKYAFQSKNLIK